MIIKNNNITPGKFLKFKRNASNYNNNNNKIVRSSNHLEFGDGD